VVLSTVRDLRMVPLGWDVDPRDWSRPGTALISSRLLAARPGDILLCHDGGGDRAQTIESLRMVLPTLKGHGLKFVTL
jgi:peptidoglycan-N-acetylglucosamine deacetylase